MPTSIQQIYTQFIADLPPAERLRLATLILTDLVQNNIDVVEPMAASTNQTKVQD
ncbi:MAG: hypothetical protein AAGF24_05810 [Cyanobacteria bacterium P01_H01_bin.121]